MPARRLKTELKAIVDATARGSHTIITLNDEPVAILMPIDLEAFHEHVTKKAPDYLLKPERAPRGSKVKKPEA